VPGRSVRPGTARDLHAPPPAAPGTPVRKPIARRRITPATLPEDRRLVGERRRARRLGRGQPQPRLTGDGRPPQGAGATL